MVKMHAILDSNKMMKSKRSADRSAGNLLFYDLHNSNIGAFQEDFREDLFPAFIERVRVDKKSGEKHVSPINSFSAAGGVLETPDLRIHIVGGAVLDGRITFVVVEDKSTGFFVSLKGESDKRSLSGGISGFRLPAEKPIEALNQIVDKWSQFMETMRQQHPGDTKDYRGGVLRDELGKIVKPMDLVAFDQKFVEPTFGKGRMDLPSELIKSREGIRR